MARHWRAVGLYRGDFLDDLQLSAAWPDVKMLVTSWKPLNLAAEWRYDLSGLAYPRANHDELESLRSLMRWSRAC